MVQQPNAPANSNVTSRLKQRVRELTIMHEIARAVTSILDLQSVLNRIVESAVYLTNAEEGFIMLVDEASNQLRLRAGKGLGDKAAKVMSIPVTDSLAGEVVSSGKPLRMGGKGEGDSYKVKTGYLVKSILNVPIKGQDRVLGVLSVDHAVESMRTFTDHDVTLLTNLAEYAAIAIENASRYEEASARAEELARSLAEVDALPEVPTRESDREALEKFNTGLRNQRDEVTRSRDMIGSLAQELRDQAHTVEQMAHRLGAWNEEVDNLIPQLDWIAQTALAQKNTGPLVESPVADNEIIATLRTLLNHASVGILLCDVRGHILDANPAAVKTLQKPQNQLIGKSLIALSPADARWEHMIGSLRLALALGSKKSAPPPPSTATLYVDSTVVKATLTATGVNKRRSVAIIAFLQDATIETQGWRARDEALIALSENLRTPMSAIGSYSDLLLNESVGLITKGQKRYLRRIRGGVDKMEENLIDFTSRPSFVPPAPNGADRAGLSQALNEAMNTSKEELKSAGVMLTATVPNQLPAVQIPLEHFTKIMTDLLIRASEYAQPQETIEVIVTTQAESEKSAYLVIAVHNNSPHPYAKDDLESDVELSAIAKAVEYQGGRIWIDVDYAGRWTISFLLPAMI